MAKDTLWLRHKIDGTIYGYNDLLAKNRKVETVTEDIAFPERYILKKQQGRKSEVDVSTKDVPDKPKAKGKAGVRKTASKGL